MELVRTQARLIAGSKPALQVAVQILVEFLRVCKWFFAFRIKKGKKRSPNCNVCSCCCSGIYGPQVLINFRGSFWELCMAV